MKQKARIIYEIDISHPWRHRELELEEGLTWIFLHGMNLHWSKVWLIESKWYGEQCVWS